MMTMQTTHGLFLTCTQKIYIYQLFGPNPFLARKKKSPLTWKADVLLMVANPHPLWSLAW
jgi:hypothetical protein